MNTVDSYKDIYNPTIRWVHPESNWALYLVRVPFANQFLADRLWTLLRKFSSKRK